MLLDPGLHQTPQGHLPIAFKIVKYPSDIICSVISGRFRLHLKEMSIQSKRRSIYPQDLIFICKNLRNKKISGIEFEVVYIVLHQT